MASEFGFTTRATCLLAAGGTALVCGLLAGDLDLVRAGVLAAAVPIIAAVVVRRSRVSIANRRAVHPPTVESGGSVVVELTIANRSRLRTGALMLEDQLPTELPGRARFVLDSLASRESRTVAYRLNQLPRGRYRVGPLRVRLNDPFHLIDLRRSFTASTEFLVRPIVDRLPPMVPPLSQDLGDNVGSHSIGTNGADDASTRDYRPGDAMRKIHWRTSARLGTLRSRQDERPWQGRATLLLDVRLVAHAHRRSEAGAPTAEDMRNTSSLEWAVSAAASIGTHLLKHGRRVDLITDTPGRHALHTGDAATLINTLAGVTANHRPTLAGVRPQILTAARESAVIAIVGDLDEQSLRTLAECHGRGDGVPAYAFVLDTASWSGARSSGSDAPCHVTMRALRAAGWRTGLVTSSTTTPEVWRELMRNSGVGAMS